METGFMNRIIGLALALVVGGLLVGGLLIPSIEGMTATEKTFENVGRYYVQTEIDADTTITMDYDIENNVRSWYIDGELLEYEPTTVGPEYTQITTVVGADNLLFRTDGRCRGLASTAGNNDYSLAVSSESITYGAVVSHAPLFVASTTTTDYVLSNVLNAPRYILGNSELIACGYTSVNVKAAEGDDPAVTTNAVISFTGTVNDGVEITVFDSNYTFTVENVVINATAHNGYKNLYDFTSVEFDVISEYDQTTHCTYSVLAVPASVTAELSNHLNATEIAMFGVISILGIVALVVVAANGIRNKY